MSRAETRTLHGLCARRACRGESRACLARYAPLVPEEAREGAKEMIAAKSQGLSFDDAREDVAALAAWAGAVDASYCGRSPGGGQRHPGLCLNGDPGFR
jgi:hypothetical protein